MITFRSGELEDFHLDRNRQENLAQLFRIIYAYQPPSNETEIQPRSISVSLSPSSLSLVSLFTRRSFAEIWHVSTGDPLVRVANSRIVSFFSFSYFANRLQFKRSFFYYFLKNDLFHKFSIAILLYSKV